jgi:uncharacterized membrane protein YesL
MGMVWNVIKQSVRDVWEELLYLLVFNIIWLVGTLLIIPWPFVTFGLFFIAHDIGQGKGIKFSTFFTHARHMWKQAYIWGAISLGVMILLWFNLNFYANLKAQAADIAQIIFIGLTIFWLFIQLVILPFYPRLQEPGFKLALRNAVIVVGRYPLANLALSTIAVLIGALSSFFPAFAFLVAPAMIAITANRMVGAMIEREIERGAMSGER